MTVNLTSLVSQKAPWLAQTKLHIPQIRGDSIARQRLSNWLAETAVSMPIILISAPAGYGKTTLLATLQDAYDSLNRSRIGCYTPHRCRCQ